MSLAQQLVRFIFFIFSAIAILGGILQMSLGDA